MRRTLRCAFAVLLSLALAASGATVGIASQTAAQGEDAQHFHHADHHQAASDGGHGHHAHVVPDVSDEAPQAPSGHPSKSCCTACTVASPLPPALVPVIELLVSRAVYAIVMRFDVAIAVPIDPGIPKRIG